MDKRIIMKFAAAAAVLALAGCGNDVSSEKKAEGITKPLTSAATEEDTQTTEDTTSAAEITEAVTESTSAETETETETTEVSTEATSAETTSAGVVKGGITGSDHNIIPGVELGDNKDDVLGKFGDYNGSFDGVSKPSTTYNYSIDGSELFGVDMKGIMFFEFSNRTDELICYGYRFGNVISDGRDTYPYSGDELKTAYEKVLDKLIGWYGGSAEESDLTGIFKEYIISIEDDSEIWSVYGVNMWGENSGVNEVIVSHAISNEKMMSI